jgi:hypothetical protein
MISWEKVLRRNAKQLGEFLFRAALKSEHASENGIVGECRTGTPGSEAPAGKLGIEMGRGLGILAQPSESLRKRLGIEPMTHARP